MTVIISHNKLKCECCKKIIPNGRVLMLDKPIGDLYEVKINHLCLPCHTYISNSRKRDQIDAILRTMIR